jgi:TonB family protein
MQKIVFLSFLACILLGMNVYAQKQNTYFLKNNGDYVKQLDSADFIRIVQEPEKGSKLYFTREFYKSRRKKSYGYSNTIDPPRYEGQFVSFFENGNRKQVMNYLHGKAADTVYNYFPNGVLYSTLFYSQSGDSSIVYMEQLSDSTGNSLVTRGTGHAVIYDEDFKYITGQGDIKNGKYNGVWTGELRTTDTLRYKEVYAEGKMLSGESTDAKGNVYHYTTSEVKPHYKDGMDAFFNKIGKGVRYPTELAAKHIQGVAQIKFVVLRNGKISDVHAINEVHPGLAAEAMRMIKSVEGWEPGIQKGRIVDVSYVVPISFTLGY